MQSVYHSLPPRRNRAACKIMGESPNHAADEPDLTFVFAEDLWYNTRWLFATTTILEEFYADYVFR